MKYASEELQADREIVLVAVLNHRMALQYACKKLQGDPELILRALTRWLS